jgi:hypothetical protein
LILSGQAIKEARNLVHKLTPAAAFAGSLP